MADLPREMRKAFLRRILSSLATLALTGLAAATLLRIAPGFDVDARELDGRTSAETQRQIRGKRPQKRPHPRGGPIFSIFYFEEWVSFTEGGLGRTRQPYHRLARRSLMLRL